MASTWSPDSWTKFEARHLPAYEDADALAKAERAGAERSKVRAWRQWAESELSYQREKHVASAG